MLRVGWNPHVRCTTAQAPWKSGSGRFRGVRICEVELSSRSPVTIANLAADLDSPAWIVATLEEVGSSINPPDTSPQMHCDINRIEGNCTAAPNKCNEPKLC